MFKGPIDWNLPADIRSITFNMFKQTLSYFTLDCTCYF